MEGFPHIMQSVEVNHIWKYRRQAGMGQKRLAYLLNHADRSDFAKWERGEKMPSIKNLFKLAYIFQVPAETLYADLYQKAAKEVGEHEEILPQKRTKVENTPLFA